MSHPHYGPKAGAAFRWKSGGKGAQGGGVDAREMKQAPPDHTETPEQDARMDAGTQGAWDSLTDQERLAIRDYTNASGHYNVPAGWAQGLIEKHGLLSKEDQRYVDLLTRALGKGALPEAMMLYRGLSSGRAADNLGLRGIGSLADARALVGRVFNEHNFGSFSLSSTKAGGYAGDNGIVLALRAPKGMPGMWVSDAARKRSVFGGTAAQSEREFLAQRGVAYKVTGAREQGGKVVLDVQVVRARARPGRISGRKAAPGATWDKGPVPAGRPSGQKGAFDPFAKHTARGKLKGPKKRGARAQKASNDALSALFDSLGL